MAEIMPETNIKDRSFSDEKSYVNFLDKNKIKILICAVAIVAGLLYSAFSIFSVLVPNGFTDPSSESTYTNSLFSHRYVSPAPDIFVVLSHPIWTPFDRKFKDAYFDLKSSFKSQIPSANGFTSYFDYPNFPGTISQDGKKAMIAFRVDGVSNYALEDFERAVRGTSLTVNFGGLQLTSQEITTRLHDDLVMIETRSIPVLIVLLIMAYGGVAATLPSIFLALWTFVLTLAALHAVSTGFNVTTYVTNVTTAFGIGIAIDYSIFMHLRFCEEMKKPSRQEQYAANPSLALREVVEKMLLTSGRTVLFSGGLLMSALIGALQFNMYYLTTMSLGIVFISGFASFGAVTFVPALYLLMGHRLFYWSTDPLYEFAYIHLSALAAYLSKAFYRALSDTPQQQESGRGMELVPQSESPGITDDVVEIGQKGTDEENNLPGEEQLVSNGNSNGEEQLQSNLNGFAEESDATAVVKGGYKYLNGGYKYLNGKVQPSEEDMKDSMFRAINFIVTYPWPFLIGISACLLALTITFCMQVKLANFTWAALPVDSPLRPAYESLLYDFPVSGKTDMQVYLQTVPEQSVTNKSFLVAIDSFCSELRGLPYISGIGSMVRIDKTLNIADYVRIYANPNALSNKNYSQQTQAPYYLSDLKSIARVSIGVKLLASDPSLGRAVRKVRSLLQGSFKNDDGSSMLLASGVTGGAAIQYDTLEGIRKVLPGFAAVVVCAMFLFILLLTGSLVLPIKTIATAALSITGSFGFLMFVFQDNNGSSFLQFNNNFNCLDPIQLLFIFLVAFGLALDYEVFLLGRIQELYEKTGDSDYAIVKGISSSSRVISLAAILICTAVGGFLASGILVLKMIGMGIGLSIVMDATIIRCILLPSIMATMGSYNWYAPQWLKQLVNSLGLKD